MEDNNTPSIEYTHKGTKVKVFYLGDTSIEDYLQLKATNEINKIARKQRNNFDIL